MGYYGIRFCIYNTTVDAISFIACLINVQLIINDTVSH